MQTREGEGGREGEKMCVHACVKDGKEEREKKILRVWDMQRKSRRIICKRIYWQNLNILPILRDISVKRRKEKMIFI